MAAGRLRPALRRADFKRTTARGRRLVSEHFLIFVFDRGDAGQTRLGITVTRKVGNAVRRNRIKRLVREWFRQRTHPQGPLDLVVIAKRDFPTRARQSDVSLDLARALAEWTA